MARLFGTDGVRGIANTELTPELAFKLGKAGATVLTSEIHKPKILVGRDTRISGQMLESALVAGMTVQLEGWGGWSGKYIISQSRHSVGGSYTTQIKLRKVLEGY